MQRIRRAIRAFLRELRRPEAHTLTVGGDLAMGAVSGGGASGGTGALFVTGQSGEVLYSEDNGATWRRTS